MRYGSSAICFRVMLIMLLMVVSGGYCWTVCIDPGHGGTDPGTACEDGSYPEAEFVMEIAAALYDSLNTLDLPDSVFITRLWDQSRGPEDRARIGHGDLDDAYGRWAPHPADIFISIHFDTWQGSVSGTHIYVNCGSGTGDNPEFDPPRDSCLAFATDLISSFVLITGVAWEDARAYENSHPPYYFYPPPSGYYEPPDDGIMGRSDLDVLDDRYWSPVPEYHARCLIECEFMNADFCEFVDYWYGEYIDYAVQGILWAMRLYRQRADPGGRGFQVSVARQTKAGEG